jgi:hypothetical protein
MKPGNRVEDKTLATRKVQAEEELFGREPAACDGQHTSDLQSLAILVSSLGGPIIVVGPWEVVDERR